MHDEIANPLNPPLYFELRKVFGEVRVSNEGERFTSRKRRDRSDPSKWSDEILESGEEYRVCCPYCGDTRFRLYINHMWGTIDKPSENEKKKGWKDKGRWRHLIHCFNEDCPMDHFEEHLKPYISRRPHLQPGDFTVEEAILRTDWPGECVPLTKLPGHHPALLYLQGRDFDPAELVDLWGVRYCVHCPESPRYAAHLIEGRIIIPIYWEGELVGWQARALDNSTPKYYTMPGMKRRRILYNGDRARQHATGVLVEGVTDAWRVGIRSVGSLGKSVSYFQRLWLGTHFGHKRLLNMMDPDAWDDVKWVRKMEEFGRTFSGEYIDVKLPGVADPAKWSRADLYDHVRLTAKVNLE